MSNPTSNFGWQMPTPTDLVTDLPADFEVFGQAVDSTMADLKGGTTGQMLTKATNTDMDFTWVTPQIGDITAITATSPLTGGGTSGDVTVGIQAASTSQSGAVQLTDSTSSTSTTTAATPNSVKSSYDLANGAIPKSTVTGKGSIVAATGSSAPANLAVGNNGETLVADSSTSTGLRYTAGTVQANPVLNSAFQIFQRGTSTAGSTTAFGADRWQAYRGTTGSTYSRQVTNDTTNLPSIQYCLRVQRDSGNSATNQIILGQNFETVNSIPYAGKTVTFSFYARAGANYSPTSSALPAYIYTGTGTDQNGISSVYTGNAASLSGTATLTTTWQRFTFTGTLPTTMTEMSIQFPMNPTGTAGANDYYEITGVQIDIGSVALPFRTYAATIQGELAACQRYYVRTVAGTAYGYLTGVGGGNSTTTAVMPVQLPVVMRVAPTSVEYANAQLAQFNGGSFSISSIVLNGQQNTQFGVIEAGGATGLTTDRPTYLRGANNTAGYLGFSAEL